MREISFRGRNKLTGAWVYGDLRNYERTGAKAIFSHELLHRVEVDPATVGQYTNIFTKDEVDGGDTLCTFIYEGDIVEPVLTEGTHGGFSWGRHVVVFDQGAFCLKDCRGNITPMCNYSVSVKFKMLGNVWDNPELLEVSA